MSSIDINHKNGSSGVDDVTWFRSIRIRIPALIAVVLILPMVFFWYYMRNTGIDHARTRSIDYLENSLYTSSLLMDALMEQVSEFGRRASVDPQLIKAIENYQQKVGNGQAQVVARSQISLLLNEFVSELRSLESMYIIFPKDKIIVTMLPDPQGKEFFVDAGYGNQIYEMYYSSIETPIAWYSLPAYQRETLMLSYIRPIQVGDGAYDCVLLCNLKDEAWTNILQTMEQPEASIYITSYNGRILIANKLWTTQSNLANEGMFTQAFQSNRDFGAYDTEQDRENYLVTHYNSPENRIKYLIAAPSDGLIARPEPLGSLALLAVGVGLLSVALGSMLLYRVMVQPLNRLMQHMQTVEQGQLVPLVGAFPQNEIGVLLHRYNRMVNRLKQLIDEVYVQQLLRKQAELSAMQAQMDEHFLYNIMNTIYAEACREQAENCAQMLLILSRYFRLSLAQGQSKIPLDQVIETIRYYVKLQKMRFGEDLRCKFQIFEDADRYIVPKHLFQPIVENAIVHGFAAKTGVHHLKIMFQEESGYLCFRVEDNGIGMTAAVVREKGFALNNIQEQIRIEYGIKQALEIHSRLGEGSIVQFKIPLERCDTVDERI